MTEKRMRFASGERKKLWTMDCGLWTKRGFTLVEIMVVVGIIGLILSMAIPNFINARKKTRAKVCVNNLHQIHGAKQQWALDTDAGRTDTPTPTSVLSAYLEEWPVNCPAGGTYGVNNVSTVPTCDVGTADTVVEWDDHIF